MDWAVVVAAGITGVVGLAGIGGTLLSARIAGRSEDKRAKLAEKRRIYANCLAALANEIRARSLVARVDDRPPTKRRLENLDRAIAASVATATTVFEVHLVGSLDVAALAMECHETLAQMTSESEPENWGTAFARLIAAMRADLGEPMPKHRLAEPSIGG
ncbi:MAG: hypothetical protein WAL12_20985 [Trebonia sp.]